MAPFSHSQARAAFEAVVLEVEQGRRLLLAAFAGEEVVGTVQVNLAMQPNSPHRVRSCSCSSAVRRAGAGSPGCSWSAPRWWLAEGKTLLALDTVTGTTPSASTSDWAGRGSA